MLGPSALRFYWGVTPPQPPLGCSQAPHRRLGGKPPSFCISKSKLLLDVNGGCGGKEGEALRLPPQLHSGITFLG